MKNEPTQAAIKKVFMGLRSETAPDVADDVAKRALEIEVDAQFDEDRKPAAAKLRDLIVDNAETPS